MNFSNHPTNNTPLQSAVRQLSSPIGSLPPPCYLCRRKSVKSFTFTFSGITHNRKSVIYTGIVKVRHTPVRIASPPRRVPAVYSRTLYLESLRKWNAWKTFRSGWRSCPGDFGRRVVKLKAPGMSLRTADGIVWTKWVVHRQSLLFGHSRNLLVFLSSVAESRTAPSSAPNTFLAISFSDSARRSSWIKWRNNLAWLIFKVTSTFSK